METTTSFLGSGFTTGRSAGLDPLLTRKPRRVLRWLPRPMERAVAAERGLADTLAFGVEYGRGEVAIREFGSRPLQERLGQVGDILGCHLRRHAEPEPTPAL